VPRTSLTRRVMFAAAHRYRRPDWSDQENAEIFGACAHPNYHGHTYVCDVTVAGPVDEETGFLVDLAFLDKVLQREVRDRFDHRNINLDVPEFADGKMIPTGENLARFICERVQSALAHTTARVIKVHLAEDATLSSSYEVDA
jgi:6-pyruvoyltetrahydropterin/6-carboxytetrahydropterin synthase